MLIVVCNGSTDNVTQMTDNQGTVQDRLNSLVSDHQFLPSTMIDSQILQIIIRYIFGKVKETANLALSVQQADTAMINTTS